MFDQFDPTGVNWPLSPVPVPGVGTGEATSPEETTKLAVKQLYTALDAFSGNESSNLWEEYMDALGGTAGSFGPEQVAAATVRTYRIWFFSLTQMLVESYTIRLVHDRLVVADHRGGGRTQEWLWGLPQSDREQLLKRCTATSDDLVDEMATLRKRRDGLLYTFGGLNDVEFEESLEDARRALDVLTALDDLVSDDSAFSYVPDGVSTDEDTERVADTDDGAGDGGTDA